MHLHHLHLLHNMKVKYVHTPFFHFHTHLILYNIHHYSILVYIFLEIGLFIAHWAICNFFWGAKSDHDFFAKTVVPKKYLQI